MDDNEEIIEEILSNIQSLSIANLNIIYDIISRHKLYKYDKCPSGWIRKDRIGEDSVDGDIYDTCCESNCMFITKEVDSEEVDKEKFMNEVNIHRLAAKHGISPEIYDVTFKKEKFEIVMQKMKMTLNEYVIALYEKNLSSDEEKDIVTNNMKEIIAVIDKMHSIGIVHADLHPGNIMIDFNDKWKIIDFGGARIIRMNRKVPRSKIYDDYSLFILDLDTDPVFGPSIELIENKINNL